MPDSEWLELPADWFLPSELKVDIRELAAPKRTPKLHSHPPKPYTGIAVDYIVPSEKE